jgi:hypothetical protein
MAFELRETKRGRLVLLFYDGFEWRAREKRLPRMYALARRGMRFIYRTLKSRQIFTGYYSAFRALGSGLGEMGCDVRVNDFRTARKYPDYPIGISGYPTALGAVNLPNPVVFGPGDFGSPGEAVAVAAKDRIKFLIRASEWLRQMYLSSCGEKAVVWYSPIDTDRWADCSTEPKSTDVLIYDKIHWDRDRFVPDLIDSFCKHLDGIGLRWEVIRYGDHHSAQFSQALRRSRSMAFLSHHETQGRASLEAMSSGVPVFAWDEGIFMDPALQASLPESVQVSSVPYFDNRCGMRFKCSNMIANFDVFWQNRMEFDPRAFILENFTLEARARAYLEIYQRAGA